MPNTPTTSDPHHRTPRYRVRGFRSTSETATHPELRGWLARIEIAAAEGYSRELLSAAGTEIRTLYGIVERVDRRMRSGAAAAAAAVLVFATVTLCTQLLLGYIGDAGSNDAFTWLLAHDVPGVVAALPVAVDVAGRAWHWQTRRVVIARDRLNRWLPPLPTDTADTAAIAASPAARDAAPDAAARGVRRQRAASGPRAEPLPRRVS